MCTFFATPFLANRYFADRRPKNVHLLFYEVYILWVAFCKIPVGNRRPPKEYTLLNALQGDGATAVPSDDRMAGAERRVHGLGIVALLRIRCHAYLCNAKMLYCNL